MGSSAPDACAACYSCAWVSEFTEPNGWSQLRLHFLKIQVPELVPRCWSLQAWRTKRCTPDNTQRVSDVFPFLCLTLASDKWPFPTGESRLHAHSELYELVFSLIASVKIPPQEGVAMTYSLLHLCKIYEPCPTQAGGWGGGDTPILSGWSCPV